MRPLAAVVVALGLLASHLLPAPRTVDRRPGHALTIDFLDVGQGDAILVRSPEGRTALIDAGPSRDVVPLLGHEGVNSIDLAAVTHHHADHYAGMDDVIRRFRPGIFLSTDSSHASPSYFGLMELVRDEGIRAIFPTDAPRKVELGSVVLTILPQPPENLHDENDNSIGIRVQYGNFSALLTGDSEVAERAAWERSVPGLLRDCTVLKLAHHGSRNGTDARWLALVNPKLAVASLGRGNEFGHPHPETLAMLRERGIPLLRTDLDGTVTVVSDGKAWGVVGRQPSPRGPPKRDREVLRSEARRPEEGASSGRRIEINSASREELESLPGIGPVIAGRIIEGRPYRSVDELLRIKGIGAGRLAEIRPSIRVR